VTDATVTTLRSAKAPSKEGAPSRNTNSTTTLPQAAEGRYELRYGQRYASRYGHAGRQAACPVVRMATRRHHGRSHGGVADARVRWRHAADGASVMASLRWRSGSIAC
jgi:hypothetical protein